MGLPCRELGDGCSKLDGLKGPDAAEDACIQCQKEVGNVGVLNRAGFGIGVFAREFGVRLNGVKRGIVGSSRFQDPVAFYTSPDRPELPEGGVVEHDDSRSLSDQFLVPDRAHWGKSEGTSRSRVLLVGSGNPDDMLGRGRKVMQEDLIALGMVLPSVADASDDSSYHQTWVEEGVIDNGHRAREEGSV